MDYSEAYDAFTAHRASRWPAANAARDSGLRVELRGNLAAMLGAAQNATRSPEPATNILHEYSLRKHWDSAEFEWVVQYIRAIGYEQQFIGRRWTYYDVGVHQYWPMGNPLPETTSINRAVRRSALRGHR